MADLITRQAAIDVLDRNHILGQGLLNDTLDHIADAIMALPPAQPDVPDTNVGDTISRQAVLSFLRSWQEVDGYNWGERNIICAAINEVEALPSAQPEIIRCKECKHWLDIDDGRQKHRMCADIYGDWFCADAERRTDEADYRKE